MGSKIKNNCIRIENNKYYLNLYHEDFYSIKVCFQEKQFTLRDLDDYYMEQINNRFDGKIGDEIEVLPSIYYIKAAFLKKDTAIKNDVGILKLILDSSYSYLYNRQNFNITISVKNIRNKFKVVDSRKYSKESGYYRNSEYVTEERYLDPTDLPYPDTLGKGAGRCIIWSIFSDLELLDYGDEIYGMLSHREMFEITSYNDKLLNQCLNSAHCGPIIKKMKEGKYKAKFEAKDKNYEDDIQVEYYSGEYRLSEGKHRVCMSKRFKIKSIPVKLTTIVNCKNFKSSQSMKSYRKPIKCKDVIFECYDKYQKLGLGYKDVQILNEAILNRDYVDYLEKVTGKDILDLSKQISSTRKNEYDILLSYIENK